MKRFLLIGLCIATSGLFGQTTPSNAPVTVAGDDGEVSLTINNSDFMIPAIGVYENCLMECGGNDFCLNNCDADIESVTRNYEFVDYIDIIVLGANVDGYASQLPVHEFLANGTTVTNTYVNNSSKNDTLMYRVDWGNDSQFYKFVIPAGAGSTLTNLSSEANVKDCMIYPNPTSDQINVTGNDLQKLEVISISGDVIIEQSIKGETQVIDMSSLKPGMYFIKVFTDQGSLMRSVVKQ